MNPEGPVERGEPSGHAPASSIVLTATSWIAQGAGFIRSRACRIGGALLLVCAGLAVLAVLGTAFNWCRVDVVLSGSMAPTMRPGDVILALSEPDSQVSAGQVLAFHPPAQPDIVVVHRVIQVVRHGNKVEIRTQGDDNNAPDAWTAVLLGNSAWRVSWVLPSAGYLVIWATYAWVRLVALTILVLLVVWEVLARVWRAEPR
jgi:signal peptidase